MRMLLKGILGVVLFGAMAGKVLIDEVSVAVAQERKEGAGSDAAMALTMKRRADTLVATFHDGKAPSELKLHETNLLDWKDSSRTVPAGTLWAWGKSGRPAGLLCLFYRDRPMGGVNTRLWYYEMTALSPNLALVRSDAWIWTPETPKLQFQPVPDAPASAATAKERERQIVLLAHQFTAMETVPATGKTAYLPLYPDVLHRYSDNDQGIVDGALFMFAHETNPEVFMLLECQKEAEGTPSWQVTFARAAGNEVVVHHMDQEVYREPEVTRWTVTKPYHIQHATEALP